MNRFKDFSDTEINILQEAFDWKIDCLKEEIEDNHIVYEYLDENNNPYVIVARPKIQNEISKF
jgi:hypothetical protein